MIGVEVAKKRTAWVPFLQEKVPMLAELSDYEFMLVADAIQTLRFEAGQPICKAGEAKGNDLFYIVKSGEVKGERAFGPGDFFGHVEILQQSANQTTRTASGRVELATLASDAFKALVPLHALVRDGNQQQFALKQAAADGGGGGGGKQRRHGQAAEASAAMMKGGAAAGGSIKVGKAKSAEAVKRIMGAVKSNIIFSRLNETQLQMLQGAMNEHHVAAGSNVITQGEKGNHFYVVDSGDLDAFVTSSDAGAEPRYVKSFGVGDSFGELALMYNCPRTATIQARTDVVLWSLDRVSFRMIVLEANTKKASMYETFLEKVQLLEPLSKDQRNKMVDALEEVSLKDGDKIIKEGEEGERHAQA
jgi:CRP-like cAMP-binding protein